MVTKKKKDFEHFNGTSFHIGKEIIIEGGKSGKKRLLLFLFFKNYRLITLFFFHFLMKEKRNNKMDDAKLGFLQKINAKKK